MNRIVRVVVFAAAWMRQAWWRAVRFLPKSLRFAILGAMGCLCGALAGEGILAATRVATVVSPAVGARSICLLLDTSGSMELGKLAEVQIAAKNFARRTDLSRNSVAVVSFAGYARIDVPLTSNIREIDWAIDQLTHFGGTAMDDGLKAAEYALLLAPRPRHILLFTDGLPNSREAAISAAQAIRKQGTQVVAIGTGDADRTCLEQLAGDQRLVLWARSGQFESAFQMADKLIHSASLVDATNGYSWGMGITRTGSWSSLLALGMGLSLIGGQNRYLRRALFTKRDLFLCVGGCIAVGLLSGCVGQVFFWIVRSDWAAHCSSSVLLGCILGTALAVSVRMPVRNVLLMASIVAVVGVIPPLCSRWFWSHAWGNYSAAKAIAVLVWAGLGALFGSIACHRTLGSPTLRTALIYAVVSALASIALRLLETRFGEVALLLTDASTRLVAWSILGGLLSVGLSFFIPNLNRLHACAAGALSGGASAVLLLAGGPVLSETCARLLGALLLGSLIGALIVLVETACREHWLEVAYSPTDRRAINLGKQAVTVGGNMVSRETNGRPHPAAALTYRVDKGAIVCHDAATGRICHVLPGQSRIIDGAQVTVRSRNS